ncbi:hypothetical protein [Sorangium sp. So ce1151]|uniref:hypothetical protein n=1 Tax=Sorangium sp. So ce1151 TaxID=3133332 RepID=UPI003F60ADD6
MVAHALVEIDRERALERPDRRGAPRGTAERARCLQADTAAGRVQGDFGLCFIYI